MARKPKTNTVAAVVQPAVVYSPVTDNAGMPNRKVAIAELVSTYGFTKVTADAMTDDAIFAALTEQRRIASEGAPAPVPGIGHNQPPADVTDEDRAKLRRHDIRSKEVQLIIDAAFKDEDDSAKLGKRSRQKLAYAVMLIHAEDIDNASEKSPVPSMAQLVASKESQNAYVNTLCERFVGPYPKKPAKGEPFKAAAFAKAEGTWKARKQAFVRAIELVNALYGAGVMADAFVKARGTFKVPASMFLDEGQRAINDDNGKPLLTVELEGDEFTVMQKGKGLVARKPTLNELTRRNAPLNMPNKTKAPVKDGEPDEDAADRVNKKDEKRDTTPDAPTGDAPKGDEPKKKGADDVPPKTIADNCDALAQRLASILAEGDAVSFKTGFPPKTQTALLAIVDYVERCRNLDNMAAPATSEAVA